MHKKINHKEIEAKWQKQWANSAIYHTTENPDKPKTFVLDMFPYPSGEGLHVGHPKGYIATDIYSRFKRMTGHEVLHPMGWDAFGLPAENYAIKNKVPPKAAVEKNVVRFKEQLSILGCDYDWDREINTTDPSYYKWTQWIFLQLFKKGLAYESYEPINWCPGCQTGLANEDLESDGTCERCSSVVEKRPMRQWVLKIREYADRMLDDLDMLEWPEHIKEAQRNWIGRSKGAEIDFKLFSPRTSDVLGENEEIGEVTVFTTRPDTLYGATYLVLAPEHPFIENEIEKIENRKEVDDYIAKAKQKNEQDRLDATKEKTGVKLEGITAINPASGEEIPVYIADYVLASYGTGAIMAVPAHDERDFEFAEKYGIEIKQVITNFYNNLEKIEATRTGVYALITNEKGEYLLQHYRTYNFYWLPGGGVEEGESEFECLAREILEETGFKNISEAKRLTEISYDYVGRKEIVKRNKSIIYVAKVLMSETQPISLSEREVYEDIIMEWVAPNRVSEILKNGAQSRSEWVRHAISVFETGVYTEKGYLMNSGEFDDMDSEEAKPAIVAKVGGRMTNTYKIRDWVFSRQRYWGEPIPIIHCQKCGPVAVPEDQLPVTLPEVEHYEPAGDGQSPLSTIPDWVNTTCPQCGGAGERETNTMPQWAGSSWYYLRYMDPKNDSALVSKEREKYWAPVDIYVGGDHAVRHLIYARFWHKFLYDIGVVSTVEPFQRLEFLGFILAEDGRKMSKRWGNVINPDDIVALVGADSLRVYEMFMGPFENTIAWSKDGLAGACRFLERVNGLSAHLTDNESESVQRQLHKTIRKVVEDIESFKFNTAVSAMMIFINEAEKNGLSQKTFEQFLQILAPFAPHLTEELWQELGHSNSIHLESFPVADEELAKDTTVEIGVQINGKLRGSIEVAPDAPESTVTDMAKGNSVIAKYLDQAEIKKVVYVPGRILNFIIN